MWFILLLSVVSATNTVQYQDSLTGWNTLKSENNNCYTYQVTASSWVGFGSKTTIVVEDGIVVQRSHETWDSNGVVTPAYDETELTLIGSNSEGADAVTLDELYTQCPDYLSMDESTNSIYFTTDDNNIMTSCGYVPNGCADDCGSGISISSFEFCSATEQTSIAYQNSLEIWNTLKEQYEDCYSYISTFTSWVGFGSTTTIIVESGIVVQRSYEAHDDNGVVTDSYEETELAQIGSNLVGADVKTMDEIYSECTAYLAMDEATNYIYLETDEDGLISLCGYVPKNCADDCFIGHRVSTFDFCGAITMSSTSVIDVNNEEYEQSLSDWNTLKADNDNCYTYTTGYTSWTGYGSSTTIKVEDGIVTQRSYESFNTNNGQRNVINSYEETDVSQIGTNTEGADALTMDELYAECPQYLSVDEQMNDITFTTDENNIMTGCTYYPLGCQDDCDVGIRISSFVVCADTDNEISAYEESLNDWNSLNNDCYTYSSSFTSWVGFGSTTTIIVESGIVVQRSYEAHDDNGVVTDSYDEKKPDDIGTNSLGKPALTMDELYEQCPTYLNQTDSSIYWETDDNNVMSLCGYFPNNCQDDCFEGIRIDSLEFVCDGVGIGSNSSIISIFYAMTIVVIGIIQQM